LRICYPSLFGIARHIDLRTFISLDAGRINPSLLPVSNRA
jgi:hypothetical protein